MLPMGIMVALISARFAREWWFLSVILGLILIELTYRKIILNTIGVFDKVPKFKLAIWLFSIQIFLVSFLFLVAFSIDK